MTLAHGNVVWGKKKKDKRVGNVEPLIPWWPFGCLWYGAVAVLLLGSKDKSHRWRLEMDPVTRASVQSLGCYL